MKKYTKKDITRADNGIVYVDPDGNYKVNVQTKPNGSESDYLSVGKFTQEVDEFGDLIPTWIHYDYPNKFKMDNFLCKRDYTGKGNCTKIEWTILAPKEFLENGYMIAMIGTGQGGNGYRKTGIEIFFDKSRIERGIDVVVS